MKRVLLPLALAAAITVPVGAQYGWFSLNGGLIARLSSSETAATIRQDGAGAVLDLYAGATRIFRATSAGITSSVAAIFADGTPALPSMTFASDTDTGLYWWGANQIAMTTGGVGRAKLATDSFILKSDMVFGWSSNTIGDAVDLFLLRDAPNTLALRNGTNAQTLRLYGTYIDPTNFRRLGLTPSGDDFVVQVEANGTGAQGNLIIANRTTNFWTFNGTTGGLLANGAYSISTTGNIDGGTLQTSGTYTVAALPTCNAAAKGTRAHVSDANSTTFNAAAAGGGANAMGVVCNGTGWVIG